MIVNLAWLVALRLGLPRRLAAGQAVGPELWVGAAGAAPPKLQSTARHTTQRSTPPETGREAPASARALAKAPSLGAGGAACTAPAHSRGC